MKYYFFGFLLLNATNISFAQVQQNKIDSLSEVISMQFYEFQWLPCINTASVLIALDSNKVEGYIVRSRSYMHLKNDYTSDINKQSPDKTVKYLSLIKLAKNDLEKIISLSPVINKDYKEQVLEDCKKDLDSCNAILMKYRK